MSFTVYIIYSAKLDKYYVGYTEDISKRLLQHNEGISTFNCKANDFTGTKYKIFFYKDFL